MKHITLEEHLRSLCLLPGLSGHEQAVSRYINDAFTEQGFSVTVDTLGNTMTTVQGSVPDAPSILVTSHMDQLGFVVKTILDDGYIKLDRLGGIPEKALPTLRVAVQTKSGALVHGLIGLKSHHLTPADEKYKVDPYGTLYVDIGCGSRAEVLALGINIGSPVIYRPAFEKMQGKRCNGTAFDNRAACALLLGLAERLSAAPASATVYLAGTVQEEYTIRGAILAARALKPDLCICLDVAMSGDTPDLKGVNEVKLGGGPVMSLYNFHGRGTLNGAIPHPAMVRLLENTAEKTGIPLQRYASIGGLSELAYMQLEGKGICGVDLGVPCRYTHTQIETCDLGDMDAALDLLEAAVRAVGPNFDMSR
jgi:putative aminopeptidase FrvX